MREVKQKRSWAGEMKSGPLEETSARIKSAQNGKGTALGLNNTHFQGQKSN
jgi:hypothetical protein